MKNLLCITYLLLGTSIGRTFLFLLLLSMFIPSLSDIFMFIAAILVFGGFIYMVIEFIVAFIEFINGK